MDYLNKGIKAHQAKNFVLAKKHYLNQLSIDKNDANANQLLGLIHFNERDFISARRHMERSIKSNPNQAHVLVNLSAVYSNLQLTELAINALNSAIKLDKYYIDAYINLVRIYRTKLMFKEAENILIDALNKCSNNIKLIKELAEIYKETHRNEELISIYQKIEKLYNDDLNIKFDLAVSLRKVGKSQEAILYYKKLILIGMKNYQLYHNIANAYSDIGELSKATMYYLQALEMNPLYIDSHINLNNLLWEQNKLEHFLTSYIKALGLHPNDCDLKFNYISALIRTSNLTQAKVELDNIPNEFLDNDLHFLNAKYLYHTHQTTSAIAYIENNINFTDLKIDYLLEYSKYLIEDEQIQKAIKSLELLLSQDPKNQMAIAYISTAYRLINDKNDNLINNYNTLVKEYNINIPSNYSCIESYCQEINSYLNNLHTSKIQPLNQTLSNGTQTRGNLFDNNSEIIMSLVKEIDNCLAHYNNNIVRYNGLYGVKSVKQHTYSGSWSVRLKSEGYHSMHVHPMGWLSAVFYIEVPGEIAQSSNKNGWLKFGEPNLLLTTELTSLHFVKPEVGKLVIFPSYMWHGTIPFKSDKYRTVIAFDVKEV